ncbi:tail connector protein [Achromobacter phage Motura]|uniref:Tail connector protein n=1 Tax=Achromobacter phage Motura TaxID=2591403 RepID=A0A514CT03_9CAUD|nr:tail sheath [Achromobacter phage Motura]QDH83596.1 tail connector protein [Achromobacter phage Motura]
MSILQNRHSDVYIQEFDMSEVITSASSSVAGAVFVSDRGRTGMHFYPTGQSVLTEFGNPNAKISFSVYCALDFFKEGNALWGRRVVGAGAKYANVMLYNDGGVTNLAPGLVDVTNPEVPPWPNMVPTNAVPIAMFYPNKGPGGYANVDGDSPIGIEIETTEVKTPANASGTTATTGGQLPVGTYAYQVSAVSSTGETLASPVVTLVIAAGGGITNVNTIKWDPVAGAIAYRVYGRSQTAADVGLLAEIGQGTYEMADTGGLVPDTTKKPITDPAQVPPPSPIFLVNVYDYTFSPFTPRETFPCTLDEGVDGDGVATELTERINPYSQYIQVTTNVPALPVTPIVQSTGIVEMDNGWSGAAPTPFDIARAWESFGNRETITVNLLINGGVANPNVQMTMDAIAQKRQDAVALLDVPSAKQRAQDAVNYRNIELNLNSSWSSLFNPDVLEADNINGKQLYIPFSGWAAALCARTDRVANASFSIAGLNRGIVPVLKTRYIYEEGEMNLMFNAQVNYTRNFIGQGISLWEQQTLQAKKSALSWLSVRRIVNVMKTSLYKFGLYILQQPNDEFTRRQLQGTFSEYLETVRIARGISSFTVICDDSNNPAAYVNSGILRATVIIVPVLPVHELQIDFVISKVGVSFTETLRNLYGQG